MEEIYVVKVRTEPDPARLYPSERRYSALTVGGLGAVHLLLGATSLLLGGLGLSLQADTCWTGRYGGGLWLGIAAAAAGAAGILAWRRWYVDNNIRWFFICSTVAATTSLLCLVITAAALAAIQEQMSTQEIYRSIYYDQGLVHPQEQPAEHNNYREIPSLSFQLTHDNVSHGPAHVEDSSSKKLPEDSQPVNKSFYGVSHVNLNHNSSEYASTESEDQGPQKLNLGRISANTTYSLEDVSLDDFELKAPADQETKLNSGQTPFENREDDIKMFGILEEETRDKSKEQKENKANGESTHIMKIASKNTHKIVDLLNFTAALNEFNVKLNPNSHSNGEDEFNRPKKSAGENGGIQNVYSNDETQDVMTVPSIKYEPQDVERIHEVVHNDVSDPNKTLSEYASPKERLEEPEYHKVPKAGREIRTVVAINILVASALELAWSLLSASIAWKGMKNCYPHENTGGCERTVEGLERTPPPPPPSSNGTYPSNKRHHKVDGVFRKPDIISNHRHCHPSNSAHLSTVQNKNSINRLHMINTVSERIGIEPYLPMEESTMEYQERVHRFLASNNVANNTSDSTSHIDS